MMKMIKYKKKPVYVEAFEIHLGLMPELKFLQPFGVKIHCDIKGGLACIVVETPYGRVTGYVGDYLVRDSDGEFHVCLADDFKKTYILDTEVKDESK